MTDTYTTIGTAFDSKTFTHSHRYKVLDFSALPQHYNCVCKKTDSHCGFRCFCGGIQPQTQEQVNAATSSQETKVQTISTGVQTKPQMKKKFCTFCYNRRRPASEYKSHFIKSGPEFGAKVVCPLLLSQQCARCGEIGHTPKMCKSEEYLRGHDHFPKDPKYFDFDISCLSTPMYWVRPIPPALQEIHKQYEDEFVKTSRVCIMMSGDHTQYTDDYYLCEGGPNWVPYSVKPKTEYEKMVCLKYRWLRHHFSDLTGKQRILDSVHPPKQTVTPIPHLDSPFPSDPSDIRDVIKKYVVPKP
jgi:hypothetical protein